MIPASLFGALVVAVGVAGLVITAAALQIMPDLDDDWPRWAVELGGPEAPLGEVAG